MYRHHLRRTLLLMTLALPAWTLFAPGSVMAADFDAEAAAENADTTLDIIDVTTSTPDADAREHRRNTPGSVEVISSEDLHGRPIRNTSDALRYAPGVMAFSNTGGADQVLSIRGSNLNALDWDNSGVMMLQDGLPISTADGANHNRLIEPHMASSISVANGANALTYGASSLGGAMDVTSRTARNSDPRQVYYQGGKHGLASGRAGIGGVDGKYDGILTMEGQHSSGWRTHSRQSRKSLYGNAGWQVNDDIRLRFYGLHSNSRQQLAGALTRAEFQDDPHQAEPAAVLGDYQTNVESSRAAVKGSWDVNAESTLKFGLSHEYQTLYHPIVSSPYFSLLIDTHQNTTGAMLRYRLDAGNHDLIAGLNLAHTTNKGSNYENAGGGRGARSDRLEQRANSATLFAMDRWEFAPRWTLAYGAQGVLTDRDLRNISTTQNNIRRQQKTYAAFNPRVGLIRAFGENSEVFANISRIYEAPNNFELDDDARGDDSTLRAAHGMAYEVGTRGRAELPEASGFWDWSLAAYYARIRNEILSIGDPGNLSSANYDKTIHAGVEARISASLSLGPATAHRFAPLISMTYNDFRFDNDDIWGNNRLPSAPRYIIHGEAMYRHEPSGFYAGPMFDLIGARYADMANDYRVSSHERIGLGTGIKRDLWELFAQVTNLTNKSHVNGVTVDTRADKGSRVLKPGAPRMIFAGLRWYY